LLLVLAATVTLEPLHGPYPSAEEACGAPLEKASETSAFCQREGLWLLTLRDGDGWYVGPLPLQEGVTPIEVEGVPDVFRVRFAQHAFRATSVDIDGEFVWPCVGHACANQAVPVDVVDRSEGGDIEIGGSVVVTDGAHPSFNVTFWKLRILGETPRAAMWRSLVAQMRGQHTFSLPP
jgi:hypothetical protein